MNKFFKVNKANKKVKAGNIEYYVKTYWGEINKDNYEEGEYETVRSFDSNDDSSMLNTVFLSPINAANSVIESWGFNEINDKTLWNIYKDEDGLRYETSISTDKLSSGDYEEVDLTDEKYQLFKQGIIDLYVFTFVIVIGKRQEVDFDDSEI